MQQVQIPTSKSYAARALILGCLKSENVILTDIPSSSDTQELIKILESLSLLQRDGNKLVLDKSFPEDEIHSNNTVTLNLGEGGTTIRFLLTLLCLGKNKYKLNVHPRFKERPFMDQLNLLDSLGAKIISSDNPEVLCTIQGPITLPKILNIDCSKTTQVASSFWMLKEKYELEVNCENLNSSNAYIDLTESLVGSMESKYSIPADMSSASYLIAIAVLKKSLKFSNIKNKDPLQADSALIDILKKSGAVIRAEDCLVIEKTNNLKPFEVDGSKSIDLVPTLCFLASFIKGESRIFNIENLIYKETNRLKAIKDVLDQFDIKYRGTKNEIIISGGSKLKKVSNLLVSPDHRIVMMGWLFLTMQGSGSIEHREVVSKSFPDFFEIIKSLDLDI